MQGAGQREADSRRSSGSSSGRRREGRLLTRTSSREARVPGKALLAGAFVAPWQVGADRVSTARVGTLVDVCDREERKSRARAGEPRVRASERIQATHVTPIV